MPGRTETGPRQAGRDYRQMQEVVYDDAPWVFIANWKQNAVSSAHVKGFAAASRRSRRGSTGRARRKREGPSPRPSPVKHGRGSSAPSPVFGGGSGERAFFPEKPDALPDPPPPPDGGPRAVRGQRHRVPGDLADPGRPGARDPRHLRDPGQHRRRSRANSASTSRCRSNTSSGSGTCCTATSAAPTSCTSRCWTRSWSQLFPTLLLAGAALVIASVGGILLGIIAAVRQNGFADKLITIAVLVGISTPSFWLGMLLIFWFGVRLAWLPVGGMQAMFGGGSVARRRAPSAAAGRSRWRPWPARCWCA